MFYHVHPSSPFGGVGGLPGCCFVFWPGFCSLARWPGLHRVQGYLMCHKRAEASAEIHPDALANKSAGQLVGVPPSSSSPPPKNMDLTSQNGPSIGAMKKAVLAGRHRRARGSRLVSTSRCPEASITQRLCFAGQALEDQLLQALA